VLIVLLACTPEPKTREPAEPWEVPPVELLVSDPDRSEVAHAGVLTIAFRLDRDGDGLDDEGWALEIRGDGTVAWALTPPHGQRYGRASRARDGAILLMEGLPEGADYVGRIVRWRPERGEIDAIDAPTSHHDVVELEDGRIAWLAHRFTEAALDPVGVVPVTGDTVVVAAAGGSQVLVDTLDDYPVAPWWICAHNEYGRRIEGRHDLIHSNSLVPDPDGGWLVMARYLDAVLRFDEAGTFDWQLGGRDSDFELGLGAAFAHAHFTQAFRVGPSGDRLLIFDNGREHGAVTASRVVELAVDRAARQAEVVWEYRHPQSVHVGFLGDARRLPGGNTLIAWGALGTLTEVTPDGEEVWAVDLGMPVGRVELVP
jgi:hypothetical protein